jgi:hypothetical protein
MIIFDPEMISREEPVGTGALRIRYTSSPVVSKKTSTSALVPVLLETKILSKIFVAVAPAVKTAAAASVMTFVVRSALVSILKVFAISA